MVQQVVRGRLQMGATSAFGAGVTVPDATVVSLPYVWSSDAERRYVTDKFAFPFMTEALRRKGPRAAGHPRGGLQRRLLQVRLQHAREHQGRQGARLAGGGFEAVLAVAGRQRRVASDQRTVAWARAEPGRGRDLPFPFYSTTPGAQVCARLRRDAASAPSVDVFREQGRVGRAARKISARPSSPDCRHANAVRDRWFADEKKKLDAFAAKGGKVARPERCRARASGRSWSSRRCWTS